MAKSRRARVRRHRARLVTAVLLFMFAAGSTLSPATAQEPTGESSGWDDLGEIDQLLVAAMARLENVGTQPAPQTVVDGSEAPAPGVEIAAQSMLVVPSGVAVTAENFGRFTKDAFVAFPPNQDYYDPSAERVGLLFELSGSLAEQPGQIEFAVFYAIPGLATYAPNAPFNTPDQRSTHVSAVVSLDGAYRALSTQAAFPGGEFASPHLIVVFTAPSPMAPSTQSTFVFFVFERADGTFFPTITSALDPADPNAYIWSQYDFVAPISTTLVVECEREEVVVALEVLNGVAPQQVDDPPPNLEGETDATDETESDIQDGADEGGGDESGGGSGWVAPVGGVLALGVLAEGGRRFIGSRRNDDEDDYDEDDYDEDEYDEERQWDLHGEGPPPKRRGRPQKARGPIRKGGRRRNEPPVSLVVPHLHDNLELNEVTTIGGSGFVRLSGSDARDGVFRRVAELSQSGGLPLDENDFYIPSREIWNQALDEADASGADVEDLRRQVDYSFDQSVEPPAIVTPLDHGQSALLYPSSGQSAPDSAVPVMPDVKIGVEATGRRAFWQGSGGKQSGVGPS